MGPSGLLLSWVLLNSYSDSLNKESPLPLKLYKVNLSLTVSILQKFYPTRSTCSMGYLVLVYHVCLVIMKYNNLCKIL